MILRGAPDAQVFFVPSSGGEKLTCPPKIGPGSGGQTRGAGTAARTGPSSLAPRVPENEPFSSQTGDSPLASFTSPCEGTTTVTVVPSPAFD